MRKIKALAALLCAYILLSGCSARSADISTSETRREAVRELQCSTPAALPEMRQVGGREIALCWTDYEANCTTIQIIDTDADRICSETVLEGQWTLSGQHFADGRLAFCDRDNNRWLFLDMSLAEIDRVNTAAPDVFFTYDGDSYYFVRDHVLYRQAVSDSVAERIELEPDLRFMEISAYDAPSGSMLLQFILSPYSTECGTAMLDTSNGMFVMLQSERYQPIFTRSGICLLRFDAEQMGYSALYGSGDAFMFADAGVFTEAGELLGIDGADYLVGIAGDSTLYSLSAQKLSACKLTDVGITGEMYSVCALSEPEILAGAVYRDGVFRLYIIDAEQLDFTMAAEAVQTASPLSIDIELAQSWLAAAETPVSATVLEARQYADLLEERYDVRILLSSQCADAAALCEYPITLTDSMDTDEEISGIDGALESLNRSLSLYPDGFFAQFRNGVGEGGIVFLLVGQIDSGYGAVGVTYENADGQYIALDVRMAGNMDGLICHELWHAVENHILSADYSAFSPEQWLLFNPEGFSYYNDPAAADSAGTQYTLYGGGEVYFVDNYSMVNDKEDRARIMEYFMTHDDEAALLIESAAIRGKLKIMSENIRRCFDSTGWDSVRWERFF